MRTLVFSEYVASIIMGAGLLTIPLVSAHIGVVGLLLLLIGLGGVMAWGYATMTGAVASYVRDEAGRRARWAQELYGKLGFEMRREAAANPESFITRTVRIGQLLYDHAVQLTPGGERAGRMLSVGLLVYVLGADVGYLLIGATSLSHIASVLTTQIPRMALVALPLVSIGLAAAAFHPRGRGGLRGRLLFLMGGWLLAVWAMACLPPHSFLSSAAGLLIYSLTLIVSPVLPERAAHSPASERSTGSLNDGQLAPDHRVNVVLFRVEILLLIAVAATVLATLLPAGLGVALKLGPLVGGVALVTQVLEAVGVIVFALVGTGIMNIATYPELLLQKREGQIPLRRIACVGTAIPVVVYAMWILASVVSLPTSVLLRLDAAQAQVTVGLADRVGTVSVAAAVLAILFGHVFALLAVSASALGFTETGAVRLQVLRERGGARGGAVRSVRRSYAWLRALMLVVATAIALGFRAMPSGAMPITRILSVAGAAGGGLVFLVLPVLLATARCRSGWRLTVTSAVGLLVAACVVATTAGHWLTGIDAVLSVGTVGIAIWILSLASRAATPTRHLLPREGYDAIAGLPGYAGLRVWPTVTTRSERL